MPSELPVATVSVREMVDFVCRSGGLGGDAVFRPPGRALEGTRGHQRLQRQRPPEYRAEVSVQQDLMLGGGLLRLRGRIDGVLPGSNARLEMLEEIKTVYGLPEGADALHMAQVRIYAWMYLVDRPELERLLVRITYLDLETGLTREFDEECGRAEAQTFFETTVAEYAVWVEDRWRWIKRRDDSLRGLGFPFAEYRAGQRRMAVEVYRAVRARGRLFVEAPTGIGKTMSALYPALKSVGEGGAEIIFYLTAKTPGRTVAKKAVEELRAAGAAVRCTILTAKERLCFCSDARDEKAGCGPCDRAECPYARNYFDRRKLALRELLDKEVVDRSALEAVALVHEVCPFELSLDAAIWCDLVIADYNHVFDPSAYLKRFFDDPGDYIFLVDEAHNLVDRAREMFGAELSAQRLRAVRNLLGRALPKAARTLSRLATWIEKESEEISVDLQWKQAPETLVKVLDDAVLAGMEWLAHNEPAPFREELLGMVFDMLKFQRVLGEFDARYRALLHADRLVLFCMDPAPALNKALERGVCTVFFSATLSPVDSFRDVLGGTGAELVLPGPFPPENLLVIVSGAADTSFRNREETLPVVAENVAALMECGRGNTLTFFPSFKYMESVHARLASAEIRMQTSTMNERERMDYLDAFERAGNAFAVMGGIFGEGIDLVGERLEQAMIVGVGLPQLCLERDLLRAYYQQKCGAGFEYAYLYPGMNRVLQAVGRVIRSATDRGVVVLLDRRFLESRYQRLLPRWWRTVHVRHVKELRESIKAFWAGKPASPSS